MDNALPTCKVRLLQFFGDVEIDFSLAKLCLSDNENNTEDFFLARLMEIWQKKTAKFHSTFMDNALLERF